MDPSNPLSHQSRPFHLPMHNTKHVSPLLMFYSSMIYPSFFKLFVERYYVLVTH